MNYSKRRWLKEEFDRRAGDYLNVVLMAAPLDDRRREAMRELANAALRLHLFDEGYQAGKRQREPVKREAARRG